MSSNNVSDQVTEAIFLEKSENEKMKILFQSPFKVLPDIGESCDDPQEDIDKVLLMSCDEEVEHSVKVERLQKTFAFLEERYLTLLKSLQEEVEDLRRKNKELSFKFAMLIGQKQMSMNIKSERKPSTTPSGSKSFQKEMQVFNCCFQNDFRRQQLECELKDLKELLVTYKEDNEHLQRHVLQLKNLREKSKSPSTEGRTASQEKSYDDSNYVINQLNDINQLQIEEIRKIQTDLYGVLDSENMSLSAFLMAKGFKDRCSGQKGAQTSKNCKSKSLHNNQSTENQFLPPIKTTQGCINRFGSKLFPIKGKSRFRP